VQTNKINGLNTLSIVNGQHPTLPLVALDSGGTVNQKAEAAAAQFGYYGLISPDRVQFLAALNRCISQLQDEESHGHMLGELLTDSHSPIHLRARTSLMLYLLRLKAKTTPPLATMELGDLLAGWFEHHLAVLSLGLVPTGPLAGAILLPCSRKRGATKDDLPRDTNNRMLCSLDGWDPVSKPTPGPPSPWPGDPVREGVLALIAGHSPLPHREPGVHPKSTHLGRRAQTLSTKSPDTAAIPITSMVLAKGGFGPNVLRGSLPKLAAGNFRVTYYAGADGQPSGQPSGHWARFGDTPEQRSAAHLTLGVDSVTSLWVEYGSGKFSFLDPAETPHPFADSKVVGEVSWDGNGDPK
jgi:hypothetical protein